MNKFTRLAVATIAVTVALVGVAVPANAADVRTGDYRFCVGAPAMDAAMRPCLIPPSTSYRPALTDLATNDDNRPECWAGARVAEFNMCTLGPAEYTKHLLVIGDSHSNTLIGAYEAIANANGWRIDVAGHAGCYLTTRKLTAPAADVQAACTAWREAALEHVAEATDIDALVVTRSRVATSAVPLPGETGERAQVRGMVEAWERRADPSIPVIAIADNPALPSTTTKCLANVGSSRAYLCAQPRSTALGRDLIRTAVSWRSYAHLIDLSSFYCTSTTCPAVVGGVVTYRSDGNHLTAMFARTLAPYLGAGIGNVLG